MDMPTASDPYHSGECALQQRTGVRERMAAIGSLMVRDHMPAQHRELFEKLPFVVVGALGETGQPQAMVLAGPPGFMQTPDDEHLTIGALPSDARLQPGAHVGVLGIEPHTRRRNRMNGIVSAVGAGGFTVRVVQSFGNCPKYIQARQARWSPDARPAEPISAGGGRLGSAAIELIRQADTFFIATTCPPALLGSTPAHGVDASHRGGKPGFVRVDADGAGDAVLTVPDFTGNSAFNTLGNLALHPHAGLLFVDHARGDTLQLAADAELIWEGAELASFRGALRLLRYRVRAHRHVGRALALTWGAAQPAAQLADTGHW